MALDYTRVEAERFDLDEFLRRVAQLPRDIRRLLPAGEAVA
jgi:hypothetical protein